MSVFWGKVSKRGGGGEGSGGEGINVILVLKVDFVQYLDIFKVSGHSKYFVGFPHSQLYGPGCLGKTHKKKCVFSGRTTKVLPSLHQWQ